LDFPFGVVQGGEEEADGEALKALEDVGRVLEGGLVEKALLRLGHLPQKGVAVQGQEGLSAFQKDEKAGPVLFGEEDGGFSLAHPGVLVQPAFEEGFRRFQGLLPRGVEAVGVHLKKELQAPGPLDQPGQVELVKALFPPLGVHARSISVRPRLAQNFALV
jgi:hypothetical protein